MLPEDERLDAWNYVLFFVETVMNAAYLPFFLLFFYICVTQKNLHVNFRSTLFLAGVGYLIGAIHRLILVSARVCCIGKGDAPIVDHLRLFQAFGQDLCLSAYLFVVFERAMASTLSSSYNRQCSGASGAMLLTCLIFWNDIFHIVGNSGLYFMIVQTVAVVLCLVALVVILRINILLYRRRHDSMLQLEDRYHLDENIRTGRYYIPVALNDFVCKVIFIGLMTYSIFFTNIPLGRDTTHLSHAYDVMFAYQRMFFVLALTLRSEKLDNVFRRKKRFVQVMDSQATTNHFDGLRMMWS
ncbi:hypothetical protein OSTOST_26200 [Ostertagia ostertagi]